MKLNHRGDIKAGQHIGLWQKGIKRRGTDVNKKEILGEMVG